jgi:hypothetical protein
MLNQRRLQRSVGRGLLRASQARRGGSEGGSWAPLLEDLAHNGLPASGPVRSRLVTEPDGGASGSIALALRRACEINYDVTEEIRAIALGLLERQEADGSFAGEVSTACALGALHAAGLLAACSDDAFARQLSGAAARAAGALERVDLDPLAAAIALAQGADSGLINDGPLWSAVNTDSARRDPAVRRTLHEAGLLPARRAA